MGVVFYIKKITLVLNGGGHRMRFAEIYIDDNDVSVQKKPKKKTK